MNASTFIAAAALLSAPAAAAFTFHPGRNITSENGSYIIATPQRTVTVTPLSQDIFQVSAAPAGARELKLPASKAAVLTPDNSKISTWITPNEFVIQSPTTTLRVSRLTGHINFLDRNGKTMMVENEGVDNSSKTKRVSLVDCTGGNFYGAGERGHSLKLNGDTLSMYNRQNYGYTGGDPRISQMGISMPWIVSDKGYGVLFDDYNAASLNVGKNILYTSTTPKNLSYYFVNGNGSLAGAVSNFTQLTGRQGLPPFWALGYITSRYGYHTQQEALGAVDSLKQAGYPLDGIVFDLYWYGKETDMGKLAWDKGQFPNHRLMLDSLKRRGVNTVIISQPYINKIGAIDNYNLLKSKGMLTKDSLGNAHDVTTWVGDAGMFDISNPDTRTWLWNRLKPLTAEGLAGWWGDLGEPEVHPLTIRHANGETAEQFHNVYGNEWSRLIYEGLRKDFPDMRPLLLMRGGTTGLQRYSVFPWTTDVSRSWGGLQPQVNLMLNSGLSGLGYMGSDIGGFAVDPKDPYHPELYVRWLQAGVFSPVLRTHATYKAEPYNYPAQQEIIRDFIKMRYQWLPYNYTLAYENASKGLPLARPLNFNGVEADSKLDNIQDEYLWGNEVLVAPVTKLGARSRKVEFPAGEWYNWYNPAKKYSGTATVQAPLNQIPLFVKAGAFIPQYMRPIENTAEYDPSQLTVKYFPSATESEYTLFEDNRKDPESLAKNQYTLTTFKGVTLAPKSAKESATTQITIKSTGNYPGMSDVQMLTIEVMNAKAPKSVTIDGNKVDSAVSPKAIRQYGYSYDAATGILTIRLPYNRQAASISIN